MWRLLCVVGVAGEGLLAGSHWSCRGCWEIAVVQD